MQKIHIVSNRLPFSIKEEGDEISLEASVGGLATGMKSIYKDYGGTWIGWPGIDSDTISDAKQQKINNLFNKEKCASVHLNSEEIHLFYEGFSNRTIWPLFHYFTQYADFNQADWEIYKAVNQKFADAAIETLEDGDAVWVHDYQLLLVPDMIKSKKPNVTVGFFLHIPFPSYEVFRMLPWRKEIIQGMLGADLIGFHTYDYERHFFSCVRRLFGYEISFNQIHIDERIIIADSFPMGIDYEKFMTNAQNVSLKSVSEKSELHKELDKYFLSSPERKLILSIDRLDYTKGIPNRLTAFARFLEKYPEFRQKVTLIMLAVPSRGQVDHYQLLKKEVDELVGQINGAYGTINYTPIWYFYRSLPFNNLIELYSSCDVALITPVRDGMNLVAKEYVASRINNTGVLILSEMAGVAKEMGEALLINPVDDEDMADNIYQALTMPIEEQKSRMTYMKERIQRYDVFKWANEFVKSLKKAESIQNDFLAKRITKSLAEKLIDKYHDSKKRAIFLDYDGTLAPFKKNPQDAKPDDELHDIIKNLTSNELNTVTIISGRDRYTLEKWFAGHKVNLICEHGVWLKTVNGDWEMLTTVNNNWMPNVRPIMEHFVDRTPGSFIEEKNYSLVWHYRKAEPDQGELRANELKDELNTHLSNHNLEIMEGNKVIEVKSGGINKGVAALKFLNNEPYDYIMAIGDDWTDEFMFRELPEDAITIKVGMKHTKAAYKVESVDAVRSLLQKM
ncbi:bifunctional alpha,alpha-trehalose-phosphate synthase (UDP-forming)/trehalose-phosphatase [Plebeiibacterium sediminum]|uniref:Alpha,alpha-trehalose-phosphate synthase n=1 Tax=Plebeiibacterium sediminum TaxID=2992112 RepID=A0AAE3SE50_9BACT|nr:bifunctional alpha,alpha-trehalose-phosphate synthase (UDP-forming)/trehalose-phosphatase [Plebeiobacterium sediminum]MCW3786015.1 bifunctional alpha,alpha-trehalose-phosphate synthase (UDP-forming)/trehalose-phosphatase [Plebeiobacterium sediminum]